MFSEEIKKTTAALHNAGKFIGSGVVFCYQDDLYVLTAAHNIYGKSFDQNFICGDWSVEDYEGQHHSIVAVNDDSGFSKKQDVALLKLQRAENLDKFVTPHFAARPGNITPEFFFRGRYGQKPEPVNKGGIHFQEIYQSSPYQFLGTIDKKQLVNSNFSAGSDWLGGCSGSGLFMAGRADIICSGVLLEIPDKGDNGQLLFCSVEVLPVLGLNIKILPPAIYDVNPDRYSTQWFDDKLAASIHALGKRYTPDLNFKLPIGRVLDGLTRNNSFKTQLDAPYAQVFKKRRAGYFAFGDALIAEQEKEIDGLLVKLRSDYTNTCCSGFSDIDFSRLTDHCAAINLKLDECISIFYKAQREKEEANPTPRHGTLPYTNAIYALRNAVETFSDFLNSRTCQLANKPVMILRGEAGFGKSHLLGDISRKRQVQGFHTILLLGQHFTGADNPWHQLIQRQLNLQLTEDEFLGQLNAKAHLTGKRIVLVIDAINEGNGKEIWPGALKSFINKVSQYDGLGLILSVRTSYHDLLVDKSIYSDRLALSLTHYGFSELEYEAADYFFDNYGITKPRIPFLHPEFRSPLFLKLFCDGLAAKGLTEIPEGYEGITAILNFFLDAVNTKLAGQMNYDPAIQVVRSAVEALAAEIIATGDSYIPYQRAVMLLAGLESSKLTNSPGLVASKLVDEGLLAKNIFQKPDYSHEEGVYFLYERFLDHIVASLLIKRLPADPTTEFLPGGRLYEYFKDDQSCHANSGLIEAFSIQMPEKYGREFFEFVPHVRDLPLITQALIASIVWRKADNLSSDPGSPIRNFLKEMLDKHQLTGFFLENILFISGVPGHPYNALYMHEILMGLSLAQRDAGFLYWLANNYNDSASSVRRLIDWSWKDQYRKEVTDESILLSSIALSWFLISPDRNLRDSATKSIICLLQYREHLIIELLQKFEGVNDPYVCERIFAIAYGCTMRAVKLDFLPSLCDYIFRELFDRELLYPNILVRDYAYGVIAFTVSKGISLTFDMQRCKPRYRSEPITDCPTNEEIDKAYKLKSGDGEYYLYQNQILDSMTTEYGRGTARYGDFGRYVFGSALHDWGVHDGALSNHGIKRIFELGYDIKLHGNYDANYTRDNGQERIGKKYQWIVLHEILARVADHTDMMDESDSKKKIAYQGAWQPGVRDIDPSMIIKKTVNQNELPESYHCWWVPNVPLRFSLTNKEWMELEEDISSDRDQLVVTDKNGTEWVCLNIRISQSQEPDIADDDYHLPKKNFYKDIGAYITTPDQFELVKAWIPRRDRYNDDLPDPPHQTQVFSREYYWSEAYAFNQQYYYGCNGDDRIFSRRLNSYVAEVHVPSQYILWEKRRDYSIEEGISFFKPSTKMQQGLHLSFIHEEGELAGPDGRLACFDPSVNADGPSCLLVRKDLLLAYLKANNLVVFWLVSGEKRILSSNNTGDELNPNIDHNFEGFYYMDQEELKGSCKSTVKRYR